MGQNAQCIVVGALGDKTIARFRYDDENRDIGFVMIKHSLTNKMTSYKNSLYD